ncbi:hypothetical protein SH1V18_15100 [Vallitalea longa]|uniref:Uncharacterized protein n=1 Tax=Vallitalea longa TaxID=2936439 RepID=A0A9W5YAF8_9FIRM|nr:hypothetical protein [Vallitalea longa]GKX29030.1 hypothetical protein SH1V18_15100 [Vallitalea longa]
MFDSGYKFWVAVEEYGENMKFEYADGWTLEELVRNIEKQITEKSSV